MPAISFVVILLRIARCPDRGNGVPGSEFNGDGLKKSKDLVMALSRRTITGIDPLKRCRSQSAYNIGCAQLVLRASPISPASNRVF